MAKTNHVHKYYKPPAMPGVTTGPNWDNRLWACALPHCSHIMPKHYEDYLPGKATLCWECGEQTIMDNRTMAMDKPLCTDCDPNTLNLDRSSLTKEQKQLLVDAGIIDKFD